MNDDGYTLARIPGSDAIYRLPAGCPVTDENLRRFGERVSPPSGDVVSDPTDLVAWLTACYDRAEWRARDAVGDPDDGDPWDDPNGEFQSRGGPVFDHVVACGPAWRLADIGRKRKILAEHQPVKATSERRWSSGLSCVICDHGFPDYPCKTVRWLAEEFASEPGYDAQRWAPGCAVRASTNERM